jgi:tRNA-uridine 2-sulfurtransferase
LKTDKIKAVAMLSGGLDSSLAVKIVADQGLDVVGVNYSTGFCLTDHRRRMVGLGKPISPGSVRNEALRAGAQWQIPVEIIDISEEYMSIFTSPKHGYGSAINPCIDCRIFMLQKTRLLMEDLGASFIITGEVLGQRPMTQMPRTMEMIEKESDCQGLILRPLSAKVLPPTLAEEKGWIDRDKLYDFYGRSRKPQMALAKELGLTDYPQPAGGCCFLTDKSYARRVRDLFRYSGKKSLSPTQVLRLKAGRHFRLNERAKAIVGRNEAENLFLNNNADGVFVLDCSDVPGPLTLVEGRPLPEDLELAARLAARYSDGKEGEEVAIEVKSPDNECSLLRVAPLRSSLGDNMLI